MAEITAARTGELLRTLLGILQKHPDGLQARVALDTLRVAVPPTDYELGSFEKGGLRFDKIVRFATVDCVKAKWLVKDGGRWFVTEAGLAAVKEFGDPAKFYAEAKRQYRAWKKAQPAPDPDPNLDDDDGEEAVSVTLEEAQEQAREQISEYLHHMDPYEFQKLVGDLLSAMGYHVAWIAPPGRDDGIDLLAYPDPLGTRPPRIKVQVKRYAAAIPVSEVNAFMGNLGSEEVGLFVATGGFTRDAEAKARTDKQHRVTLIGLDALVKLWVKHYAALDEIARQRLPLQPVYFLAPEN
ncbi:restriction endonuclease [Gemmatimonas sp.]|uniref:restriction endonuclease n=1 Tax=Gemmatimonas sp. TaxID=1962908 RepID=UPI0025BA60B0|nr:restriction endonuclease [Gemmatimonas sp.]MCA2993952.1 restriction endonuclease [Gemmatimonas sp.]